MFESQKMIRIKEMRFVKSATALHRYHGSKLGFVLSEESTERITVRGFEFFVSIFLAFEPQTLRVISTDLDFRSDLI